MPALQYMFVDNEPVRYSEGLIEFAGMAFQSENYTLEEICRKLGISCIKYGSSAKPIFTYVIEGDEEAANRITKIKRPKDYLNGEVTFFSHVFSKEKWAETVQPVLEQKKYGNGKTLGRVSYCFALGSVKTTKSELQNACRNLNISCDACSSSSNRRVLLYFANKMDYVKWTYNGAPGSPMFIEPKKEKCPNCNLVLNNGDTCCPKCGYRIVPVRENVFPVFRGPAGGYVFYDKGEYSDGWRYLEAAPVDIRVVDGVPTVDPSIPDDNRDSYRETFLFGVLPDGNCFTYNSDVLFVNGTTAYDTSDCTRTEIGTGKQNTRMIIDAIGDGSYMFYGSESKTPDYAASLCKRLKHESDGTVYDDWFLPSIDELNIMCENLVKAGIGDFKRSEYWSSSEYRNKPSIWIRSFNTGLMDASPGNVYKYIRPIRAF